METDTHKVSLAGMRAFNIVARGGQTNATFLFTLKNKRNAGWCWKWCLMEIKLRSTPCNIVQHGDQTSATGCINMLDPFGRTLKLSVFVFLLNKNNTISSPGFFGRLFNNLQRIALLTSFWRHRFNNLQRAALLTSLIQYDEVSFSLVSFPNLVNSSWLWWIMRVVLTNQKRGNILNE